MKDIIISLISALIGGFGTAWLNLKGKQIDDTAHTIAETEGIYGKHIKETLERMDNITKERDDLKEQNIELMAQVRELKKQTALLKEQVHNLTGQVKKLTRVIEQREGTKS